jgi:hypothetical protein
MSPTVSAGFASCLWLVLFAMRMAVLSAHAI